MKRSDSSLGGSCGPSYPFFSLSSRYCCPVTGRRLGRGVNGVGLKIPVVSPGEKPRKDHDDSRSFWSSPSSYPDVATSGYRSAHPKKAPPRGHGHRPRRRKTFLRPSRPSRYSCSLPCSALLPAFLHHEVESCLISIFCRHGSKLLCFHPLFFFDSGYPPVLPCLLHGSGTGSGRGWPAAQAASTFI